jgi:DNA-binding NtrC family response regulator
LRVIAASNQDLAELAMRGAYRKDLVYRLAVMTLTLPPLRVRGDDVILLAEHFVARFSRQYGIPQRTLSPGSRAILRGHDWPGNIRELENLVHRHFVLAAGSVVDIESLDLAPSAPSPVPPGAVPQAQLDFRRAKREAVTAFERGFLLKVLRDSGGNITRAARHAGKERRAFGRLLKKHGISPGTGPPDG